MRRLDANAPFWQRAPWNDPKLCPSCGKPATEVVGGRRYSADCARTMRAFLGQRELGVSPLDVQL